jgi:3'(2'), 5'-bisphosphate nucleotidase
MEYETYLINAIQASIEAGNAILDVYSSDFTVAYKPDQSPLTLADKKSHKIILSHLSDFNIPMLSEEGEEIPYDKRKTWRRLWIIDPLDGTKEFVKRNGEFTVNIALVENGKPVLGVIYVPVNKALYFAARKLGAYKLNNDAVIHLLLQTSQKKKTNGLLDRVIIQSEKLPLRDPTCAPLTIVASHSTTSARLDAFVEEKRLEFGEIKFFSAGSSLKFCLVAEGKVHIYPKFGPTMEWDTAAGQILAEKAGAKMLRHADQRPLVYNKENLLNPWYIVARNDCDNFNLTRTSRKRLAQRRQDTKQNR